VALPKKQGNEERCAKTGVEEEGEEVKGVPTEKKNKNPWGHRREKKPYNWEKEGAATHGTGTGRRSAEQSLVLTKTMMVLPRKCGCDKLGKVEKTGTTIGDN